MIELIVPLASTNRSTYAPASCNIVVKRFASGVFSLGATRCWQLASTFEAATGQQARHIGVAVRSPQSSTVVNEDTVRQ